MKPLLEVKNISKTFRRYGQADFLALDDISFSLYPGETLGIVGESGSGKSTVAKSVIRLLDVSEGQIFLNGEEITHAKGQEKRKLYQSIQMVFQYPFNSFDPRRTLEHSISESLINQGFSKAQASAKTEELLQQCGLDASFARRYPFEVSGGQCQRAGIARALAIEPQILICDEATSALDVTIQAQIIALLRKIKQEKGMSYLFICHDLALVQSFCDRVLVMSEGKIVEAGTPDEVIMSPKTDYTKQLIDAVL